jgi:hypothetical protein
VPLLRMEIVKRSDDMKSFVILPRRVQSNELNPTKQRIPPSQNSGLSTNLNHDRALNRN